MRYFRDITKLSTNVNSRIISSEECEKLRELLPSYFVMQTDSTYRL